MRSTSRFAGYLFVALAAAGFAAGLRAQTAAKADADYLLKAYDTFRTMKAASPYKDVPWQYTGPTNISGRATDIAVADKDGKRRIYAGYATSGVWKTDDDGKTWQSIFDDQATPSIGDLAVAPSNPDILWVGTGEANLFRASMAGVGIYKSTDAGQTFTHMGLADTQTIGRILVHPKNPDIVYVAASGHGWTDNEMRGVFKTTDGGKTWAKILYKSPRTGAWDLVMDPTNPDVIYASMWQRIRRKWSDPRVEPGYDEGGVFKTTDGGRTWAEASAGLPAPEHRGRIGIDISLSNPKVLYALVDNYEPGRPAREGERDAYRRPVSEPRIKAAEIYRTDDAGKSWRKVSESNDTMISRHSGTYGWVFGQIRVDPRDENTIYSLGINLYKSTDGGKTLTEIARDIHSDHHGLWLDPKDPQIIYSANDGGFYQSADNGKTWTFANTAGGAQFYNVTLDTSSPPYAYGSIQDHHSHRGRIDITKGRDSIPPVEWERTAGGEGSHHAIDPRNPNIVYSQFFYGNFSRDDLSIPPPQRGRRGGGGEGAGQAARGNQPAKPQGPQRTTDIRPEGEGHRAQWMAPVTLSPHDPDTVYLGFQYVFRSTNRGDEWEKISPDLTSNDPKQMLPRSSSEIPYQTITALEESPRVKGLIYAGTDDGKLHVTRDAGKTWTDLTPNVPSRRWYSRVIPSQHADNVVYITQRGREDDDFAPYIYKSTDGGKTFTSLVGNIPAGPVNVIREDPKDPNTLYVGTEFGAFISKDGGQKWEVLGGGLPSTQVSDLIYHPRDNIIVISTYGHGVWALNAARLTASR
jgi:photosystem II stability/assembly factor-like uncharacterized protein